MTLSLDLSASDAKIARAEEHFQCLKRELDLATEKRHPYTLRSEFDPQTGWCIVFLRNMKVREPRLASIAGDYIHNLRSALDYIVTALVDITPKLQLTTNHQFPLYDDAGTYATKVWTMGETVGRGPLRGLKDGLTIFEPFQPYHTQPDPDADPLAQLQRLSNADKHRQILGYYPDPQPGEVQITLSEGTVKGKRHPSTPQWVNDEVEVGAFLLAKPYPAKINVKTDFKIAPMFRIEPFAKHAKGIALDLPTLEAIGTQVRLVTDFFKSI